MNLATATITVYFIGVMHLYDAGDGTREMIVPQASATGVKQGSVTLEPHKATVEIRGLSGDQEAQREACTDLEGTYSAPVCTVQLAKPVGEKIVGKIVTLPGSDASPSFEIKDLPSLDGLCARLGKFKEEYRTDETKYAGRVAIASGALDVCRDTKSRIARLSITTDTPKLAIDGVEVLLDDKAVVKIANVVANPETASRDQRSHFLWHHRMYADPMFCTLPQAAADTLPECGAIVHVHGLLSGTGVACSPTKP